MRFGLMTAAACMAAMLGVATAEAGPMSVAPVAGTQTPSSLKQAVLTGSGGAKLLLVRGGCGFGAHLTYSGRCHLNHGFRGRIRARHRFWRHHRWYRY